MAGAKIATKRQNQRRPMLMALGLLASLLLATAVSPKNAQAQATALATFRDWSVSRDDETNRCFAFTVPQRSEGKYTRRGDVIFFILQTDQDTDVFQLSTKMGYTISDERPVTVSLSNSEYTFTIYSNYEEIAFAQPESEQEMLTKIRAGSQMTIKARSSRGTDTTDTYSLMGATRALRYINTECR